MSDTTAAAPGYTPIARFLHWLIAALVLLMIPLGFVIAYEWGGPAQQFLYNLHKSIGATLIPLVVIRLLYRLTHPAPPLPSDIPAIQRFAAHATHCGSVRADLGTADRGLHYDLGVSSAGAVLRSVQFAGDLAVRSRAVGSIVARAPKYRYSASRLSRRCISVPPSITTSCARITPDAHDLRLVAGNG